MVNPSLVVGTSRDALRWLLEFARIDLDTSTLGALLDLELNAFLFARSGQEQDKVTFRKGKVVPKDAVRIENPKLVSDPGGIFPVEALRAAQTQLRDGIELLRRGRAWRLTVPKRVEVHAFGGFAWKRVDAGHVDRLLARAVDVIVAGWADVRACAREGCGNWFVPVRRQIFCSAICTRTTHWEKFIKRNPSRRRDYHGEYEQRIKSKLGPKVKVAKRTRRAQKAK
jgi:hypothetical protein